MATKLVVLGIPWDVDTDGLQEYMTKFGELKDCIVMKERASGRSRGFGYVTFSSVEDAKKALDSEHTLGGRALEVKVATPKEEMRAPSKKITRIFVARIAPSVTEAMFRSYFEAYGEITDLYMPKDKGAEGHRGIGFITFESAESVDTLMAESHELGGSTIVVDRATPKEEDKRPSKVRQGGSSGSHSYGGYNPPRGYDLPGGYHPPSGYNLHGGYGAYDAYISAATRYAALGAPTMYDTPSSAYGRGPYQQPRGMGKKIFVGRLPQEASAEDLRQHFSRFGRIADAYIPKDPKRSGHRGFGFVTFAEDGVADRVARRTHEILGHEVAIDSATPEEDSAPPESNLPEVSEPYGGYLRQMPPNYGRLYGSMDFDDYGYGASASSRVPRTGSRYRPY